MTRAYNLRWQWGQQTNIVNDSLRFTAYTPSSGQEGAASSSEIDVNAFIRQTNDYYVNQLASPYIALPIDRTRVGNMTLSATPGLSAYRPTRTYETVGATYGGMGLRSFLREQHRVAQTDGALPLEAGRSDRSPRGRLELGRPAVHAAVAPASQLLNGTVPADFTSYRNVSSGSGIAGTAQIGNEPSLDNPVAAQPITTITDCVVFKGGGFKITVGLKGFELTDDQANLVMQSGFAGALQSECGCQMMSM